MKLPGLVLVVASSALLAAAAPAPVTAPPEAAAPDAAPPPASHLAPATDYTSQMQDPPLVGEYDPATAPPPRYTEPGGLRQCVGPDGVPAFTDRRCEEIGATTAPVAPPMFGQGAASQARVRTCARNQDDLLAGVRAALETHDANRLADYYHWTGMDSASGYRMMERLDAFSARPVVDVQLVRAAPPVRGPHLGPEEDEPFFLTPPLPPEPEPALGPDGQPVPGQATAPRRAPRRLASMIRVDQMRSDADVGSTVTYFHLLTNAGCWWMRF